MKLIENMGNFSNKAGPEGHEVDALAISKPLRTCAFPLQSAIKKQAWLGNKDANALKENDNSILKSPQRYTGNFVSRTLFL